MGAYGERATASEKERLYDTQARRRPQGSPLVGFLKSAQIAPVDSKRQFGVSAYALSYRPLVGGPHYGLEAVLYARGAATLIGLETKLRGPASGAAPIQAVGL